LLTVWEHRGLNGLSVETTEILATIERPVHNVAVSELDVVLGNLVGISLEDILVESHVVGDELRVHVVSIEHIVVDVEELMRDLSLNFDVVDHLQTLLLGFAVSSASVVSEVLTQVNYKEEVFLSGVFVTWDSLLELDGVSLHVWTVGSHNLTHELRGLHLWIVQILTLDGLVDASLALVGALDPQT
jgi:hypothetical protein